MQANININEGGGGKKFLLFALFVALLAGLWFFVNKYTDEKEKAQNMAGNAIALTEQVEQYRIRLNDSTEVAAAKVHQLTLQRDDYKRMYGKETALNKKLKIRVDELQAVTTISTTTRDTVRADTVYIDSNKTYRANYSGKWIDIGFIAEKNKDPAFTYEKRDSLNLIKEVERASLFWGLIKWKKEKSATYHLISHDEKTQIVGFEYKEIIK